MSLQERTLVVKNFDPDKTTSNLLKELCIQGGPIRNIVVKPDHAFIEFEDVESVGYTKALLDGVIMFGRNLVMEPKLKNHSFFHYTRLLQEYVKFDKMRQQEQQQALQQQQLMAMYSQQSQQQPQQLYRPTHQFIPENFIQPPIQFIPDNSQFYQNPFNPTPSNAPSTSKGASNSFHRRPNQGYRGNSSRSDSNWSRRR